MSFLVYSGATLCGCFLHVPKAAGSSAQKALRQCGYTLFRPNHTWTGHHDLSKTLTLINQDQTILNQIRGKELNFYALVRNPYTWMNSLFNYAISCDPKVSGLHWEHFTFRNCDFKDYLKMFIGKHLLSYTYPNANNLAFKKLVSYYLIDPKVDSLKFKPKLFVYNISDLDQMIQKIISSNKNEEIKYNANDCYINKSSGKIYHAYDDCQLEKIIFDCHFQNASQIYAQKDFHNEFSLNELMELSRQYFMN